MRQLIVSNRSYLCVYTYDDRSRVLNNRHMSDKSYRQESKGEGKFDAFVQCKTISLRDAGHHLKTAFETSLLPGEFLNGSSSVTKLPQIPKCVFVSYLSYVEHRHQTEDERPTREHDSDGVLSVSRPSVRRKAPELL